MTDSTTNIDDDILAVSRIPIISTIFEVICRTTSMGFAAIARVTDDRWIACSVRDDISFGLKVGGELTLETTICNEIRQHHQPVVIDHVKEDALFCSHHTPAMYGFQSYISIPIFRKDGSFFGTLCAIDPKPAKLNNPETIGMFKLFADLISFHLSAVEELSHAEGKLLAEVRNSELREQFIAILGHDLRNPIGAIQAGSELLHTAKSESEVNQIADVIERSSSRMARLVENVLDFARGRLGGGLNLELSSCSKLDKTLTQVVSELNTMHSTQRIKIIFNLDADIICDENRIAQLFSNLLGNAITHGKTDAPIVAEALSSDKGFILSVTNEGEQIPDSKLKSLFRPFFRGVDGSKGLGLGLYIAAEIAKAHHGQLSVTSTPERTTFTLEIPAGAHRTRNTTTSATH